MKNAWGLCEVCGFRYRLHDLKETSYGVLVCPEDYDGNYDRMNHPQLSPPPPAPDTEFLVRSSPDTNLVEGTTSINSSGWFTSV